MVKYIGSKRLLLPTIVSIVDSLPGVRSVLDLFSGTSRVGHALKRRGYRVIANDHLTFAHTLATCYVQADREDALDRAERLIEELNRLRGSPGYVTETFCERSRYFQPRNGERIDAIRDAIERRALEPELRAVVLTSLLEAADRVDSTTGLQMAYVKAWAPRSFRPLELRTPEVLRRAIHGKGRALGLEARDAAPIAADAAYVDPPYNQHSYLGNYHVWETIARWDEPHHYGVACKRIDCRSRRSAFNRRAEAAGALRDVIDRIDARCLIVSFNDEGYISRTEIEAMLSERGEVHVLSRDAKRYVGAQIGIHNPEGRRVGRVGRLRNTEFLFVVVPFGCAWIPPSLPTSPTTGGKGVPLVRVPS